MHPAVILPDSFMATTTLQVPCRYVRVFIVMIFMRTLYVSLEFIFLNFVNPFLGSLKGLMFFLNKYLAIIGIERFLFRGSSMKTNSSSYSSLLSNENSEVLKFHRLPLVTVDRTIHPIW